MLFLRFAIGPSFVFALFFTAANGWCSEQTLDQQIAERATQYQESLRQRAAQLSPSFQAKIEAQARKTVNKNRELWKNGEISLRIALPHWAVAQQIARFVARHLPCSGFPAGLFEFGVGICNAVLTITPVLQSIAVSVVDSVVVRSFVELTPRNNEGISYFVRIVCTIVQRR